MRLRVVDIRPTQMAMGMKEVDLRIEKLRAMRGAELRKYLSERKIPVVLGPRRRTYCVDHHHLLRACWEAGIKAVPVEVKADFSKYSMPAFWKALHEARWIFLYDQFGRGPHDPVQLPESIRCLPDDPFRSLAWLVREKGGYQKADVPFAEFAWATFFRKRLDTHPVFDHMEGAVQSALRLAKHPVAAHLPGYIGGGGK